MSRKSSAPAFIVLATVAAIACTQSPTVEEPALAQTALVNATPQVVITDRPELLQTGDRYEIVGEPRIDGDDLLVTVRYGGGCARHDFVLTTSAVFAESEPVQTGLTLLHDANGDSCRALVTTDLRFDLTPLEQEWRQSYQQQSGRIALHLKGWGKQLLYHF